LGNGLPDWRARYAKAGSQFALVERIAGQQLATIDLFFELLPYFIGEIAFFWLFHGSFQVWYTYVQIWYTLNSNWYVSLKSIV
jgi:hypothetical protein